MERTCILIDGGNFYHLALKKIGTNEAGFDFKNFSDFLNGPRTLSLKRYYIGTVRERDGDERSRALVASQVRNLAHLRNLGWQTKTSKLRIRFEEIVIDKRVREYQTLLNAGIKTVHIERQREKGIDVKLATDLIMGAVDNTYDTAILVSSDGDLVPAIDWVRGRFKKKVEYIGFSIPDTDCPKNGAVPLLAMISKTDVQRILTAEDLRKFILK